MFKIVTDGMISMKLQEAVVETFFVLHTKFQISRCSATNIATVCVQSRMHKECVDSLRGMRLRIIVD